MQSINPLNGKLIADYEEHSPDKIREIIAAVDAEFNDWSKLDFSKRAEFLRRAAKTLRRKKQQLAELMALEMGKILIEGYAEVEKCAWVCEYYADNAEKFLQNEEIQTDAYKSYVSYKPLGVVLAIMPWNFPLWQVFRFAAPSLMAGNTCVLKHASNVSGCAIAIEDIFDESGFPHNAFRTLLTSSSQVNSIIENPSIKAVTLTGSTPAGKAVASHAGKNLKKTVLELGGSDAYVILDDANLEKAAEVSVTSRMINCGQSCIAAKRFIVVETVLEEFTQLFVGRMKKYQPGNPLDDRANMGPMARIDLRDELHTQVKKSINLGAKCILGGEIPENPGAFYPPTVLTDVQKGMPAFDEELFEPVAAIISAKDENDAISKANDSEFGLGGAVFSNNIEKATEIAENYLQAGSIFVNSFVKSDPRLPFGGIKNSGYGRELSVFGLREFVNIKTISVNKFENF